MVPKLIGMDNNKLVLFWQKKKTPHVAGKHPTLWFI